jgi:hypothetical protein
MCLEKYWDVLNCNLGDVFGRWIWARSLWTNSPAPSSIWHLTQKVGVCFLKGLTSSQDSVTIHHWSPGDKWQGLQCPTPSCPADSGSPPLSTGPLSLWMSFLAFSFSSFPDTSLLVCTFFLGGKGWLIVRDWGVGKRRTVSVCEVLLVSSLLGPLSSSLCVPGVPLSLPEHSAHSSPIRLLTLLRSETLPALFFVSPVPHAKDSINTYINEWIEMKGTHLLHCTHWQNWSP